MLILSIIMGIVLVPLFHVRKVIKENPDKKYVAMNKGQKQAYLVSLSDTFVFVLATIVAFVTAIVFIIKVFSSGSKGAGYVLIFFTIPSLMAVFFMCFNLLRISYA